MSKQFFRISRRGTSAAPIVLKIFISDHSLKKLKLFLAIDDQFPTSTSFKDATILLIIISGDSAITFGVLNSGRSYGRIGRNETADNMFQLSKKFRDAGGEIPANKLSLRG